MQRSLVFALSLVLFACGSPAATTTATAPAASSGGLDAARVLVNRDHRGVALGGFDPVAYFTDARPVEGDPAIRATHLGATYFFASEEHRWEFLRDPDHFAPAFGGYCGYAASIGRLSPTSPQFWQVIDDRLVLQHNQHALDLWLADASGSLTRADARWPELVRGQSLPPHYVVNVDSDGVALGGYDPISYREGTPARGAPEHAAWYGGARYLFVSDEHRGTFERDPARYAPAFGGFCGYAASIDRLRPIDPLLFSIVHDRLVVQHSEDALTRWSADPEGSLARADANWPHLVARAGL